MKQNTQCAASMECRKTQMTTTWLQAVTSQTDVDRCVLDLDLVVEVGHAERVEGSATYAVQRLPEDEEPVVVGRVANDTVNAGGVLCKKTAAQLKFCVWVKEEHLVYLQTKQSSDIARHHLTSLGCMRVN